MNSATVTRFPGVHRRADSGIYQFGLRAPDDLRSHFPSGWAVRASLKTGDLGVANEKAKALHADWSARFQALRTGRPQPVRIADLRRRLFESWERAIGRIDEAYSRVKAQDRENRAFGLKCQIDELRECLGMGTLPEWLESDAKRYGNIESPEVVTECGGHHLMLLEVMHEALTDDRRLFPMRLQYMRQRRELMGANFVSREEVRAQVSNRVGESKDGERLSHAFKEWVAVRQAPQRTQQTYKRHADQFVSLMGDPCLAAVTRTDGIHFRDRLQQWAIENKKTATTADNILVSVRALFNVARDKGWVTSNPLERLSVDIGGKESEGREPWTADELSLIFRDPLWMCGVIPSDKKAGREAAYWIPLIACYTGARLSEIAQLWTDDVTITEGQETFEFTADARKEQKLKNTGSWRAVPMHAELDKAWFM